MSEFSREEIAAGEALFREEILFLCPFFDEHVGAWQAASLVKGHFEKLRLDEKKDFARRWKKFENKYRRPYIEYEFLSNIARYYDLFIKKGQGRQELGEAYLMSLLEDNIAVIQDLCGQSRNELINPLNFKYQGDDAAGAIIVSDGKIENAESVEPLVRKKYIPALLGSSGTTAEAFEAYEYGVALGMATGLHYKWVYYLVFRSIINLRYLKNAEEAANKK